MPKYISNTGMRKSKLEISFSYRGYISVALILTGHVDLMIKYYKSSSTWHSYNLPQVLKERGVDDPKKLPNFHYREDSLKLWGAIAEFVKEVLSAYYHSDGDVLKVRI